MKLHECKERTIIKSYRILYDAINEFYKPFPFCELTLIDQSETAD